MRKAKFRVHGRFDSAGASQVATVTITRDTKVFKVRPLRRRKSYELPLSAVAAMVCQQLIMAEWYERQRAKAARRKQRSRR